MQSQKIKRFTIGPVKYVFFPAKGGRLVGY